MERNIILNDSYDDMYIPDRFMLKVLNHVYSNYLEDNDFFKPPMYLVIEGDPGEGKTVQAIAACNKKRIFVQYISASQLSGKKESESREIIEGVYNDVLELIYDGNYGCILIDDFHMGSAIQNDKITTTINSNLLIGYLMNLADLTRNQRVPIILTGNDFANVYPALIRDGRADRFYWQPTLKEKYDIVRSMYLPILKESELNRLDRFVSKYQDYNIAFFTQLINELRKQKLGYKILSFDRISRENLNVLDSLLRNEIEKVTLSELENLIQVRIIDRGDK